MGTFVSGNTPLPPAKQDAYPPTGLSTELDAADINSLWSAAGDLRNQTTGWVNLASFLPDGYVIDGSIDYSAQIQAAHDSLPATGGELLFPAGTFLINVGIISTKPSLTIRGAGGSGWNTGGATRIITTAAIIVFDFGSASVTEHRGVQVYGLSVTDTSNAGAGGTALGAFRVRRQNQTTISDVTVNAFTAGYAFTYDGTGDAITLPQLIGVKGRGNKFGVIQIGTVTAMWLAPSTYFAMTAPNTGSVAITLTGDTAQIQCAIDSYETGVKISGDNHKLIGARFEANATHIWIAGPTARRNVIVGNSFSSGGTTASIQIDNSANIFDTTIADNVYAAPSVGLLDNNLAGTASEYVFEPTQNVWRHRKSVTGSITHEVNNLRQAAASTDIAEQKVTSNGISASLRAAGDGTLSVGSVGNNNFIITTNGVTSATLVRDAGIASGQVGLLIRTNKAGSLALDQVTVGAADSGGVGFRLLRVAN